MNTTLRLTKSRNYLTFIFVGLLILGQSPLQAQFKVIDQSPSTGEKIELKPLFTPDSNPTNHEGYTPLQINSFDKEDLLEINGMISPSAMNDEGVPIFFRGYVKGQNGLSVRDQVAVYMTELNRFYHLNNVSEEYVIINSEIDEIGMEHVSIQQIYKGVNVEAGELKLHAKGGVIKRANGLFVPTPALDKVIASIDIQTAFTAVKNDFIAKNIYKRLDNEPLKILQTEQFKGELLIMQTDGSYKLVYKIDALANLIQRFIYYVDAINGDIVKSYKNYCSLHGNINDEDHAELHRLEIPTSESSNSIMPPPDGPATATAKDLMNVNRNINTYEVGSKFYMIDASRSMFNSAQSSLPDEPVGVIWTIDGFNTNPENSDFSYGHITSNNNSWSNKTGVSAHYNGGVAFEYFKNVHNRNSINGEGGNIVSLINISDPQTGGGFDNAFWNGVAMFYGNGNTAFDPLAEALDVAGHEMSHGVIQATANLVYQGESGAMNEGFADIFGSMMDRDDWFIGEDITKTTTFPTGKLRDMSNPHNGGSQLGDPGWQPKHTNEKYNGSQDNGGVHINSGIVNHAYYLFAETSGIGKDKAELIFYRALTQYLTKSSKFIDLRASVESAAMDLYGSTEKAAATQAFQDVGIGGGGNTTDYETDVEMNPGEDFLLHSDAGLSNLYIRNNNLELISDPLSEVDHISRPSVTDNGANIFFVGSDKKIYNISIDWAAGTAGIAVFDEQTVWKNVAISKDGKRIAALTDQGINEIIILDFGLGNQKTFELYNPTFSEGVSTGDVDFADAMEFDFNGEWLMYDAQNTISGTTGSIQYWDIGFLNVFNNSSNNFAGGDVQKLFNQLPEGTSVGNPTFSKNSVYIIAFDLIEGSDYKVMGANIETNTVQQIFANGGLGYPSFNNSDNQIVYELEWLFGTDIGLTALEDDKITPKFDTDVIIVEDSKRPVIFSNGERDIVKTEDELINEEVLIFPNPSSRLVNINLSNIKEANGVEVYDIQGKKIYANNELDTILTINISSWGPGTYSVNIITDTKIITHTFVKL